jgi:cytochrome b561
VTRFSPARARRTPPQSRRPAREQTRLPIRSTTRCVSVRALASCAPTRADHADFTSMSAAAAADAATPPIQKGERAPLRDNTEPSSSALPPPLAPPKPPSFPETVPSEQEGPTRISPEQEAPATTIMDQVLRKLRPAWRQAPRGTGTALEYGIAVLHFGSAILALSLGLLSFDGSLFGWHPLGMALGYQFFMAEGILAAVSLRPIPPGADRARGISAHAAVALRTGACVAVGAGSIFLNKQLKGKRHLASTHAKVGFATLTLTAAAPLLGSLAFKSWGLLPRLFGAAAGEDPAVVAAVKKTHRILGAASYFVSVWATQLVLGHHAVKRPWLTPIWRAMSLAAAAGMAGVLLLGAGGGSAAQAQAGGGGGGGSASAAAAAEEEDRALVSAIGEHEASTEMTGVKAV